jgi:spermidine/putrescine transport system ATP-binding protein
MLDLVRLKQKATAMPRQLSGGQQQRVALARALVNMPAVLLLDEPLGALDLQLRKQMQIELKEIQRTVGITFVYVTHDQEEALTMSDRIAVMNEGVLQQCGTPEEIYERPANAFVAGFIGISNLLPGQVEDGGVRLGTGQLIAVEPGAGVAAGDSVFVCVRPEKLRLGPQADQLVTVEGTVVETVYLGTATQYLLELAPGLRFVSAETGRWFAPSGTEAALKGVHGGLATRTQVAIAAGGHPAVSRLASGLAHRPPEAPDWAVTIAELLDLDLPTATGRSLLV